MTQSDYTCLYFPLCFLRSDNNTYLLFNRDPIDKMITYLTTYFSPQQEPGPYSLAIQSGEGKEPGPYLVLASHQLR